MCEYCDRIPEQPGKIEAKSLSGNYVPKLKYNIKMAAYTLASYKSKDEVVYNA